MKLWGLISPSRWSRVATTLALAAVGAVLVFSFIAAQVFRRHHIPDIPFLLLLGGVLGPWMGIIPADAAARVLPFVAALALVMVLFDGALEMTPAALRDHGRAGALMASATFTITTLACGAIAYWLAHESLAVSLLIGMCFGGAGIVIILPMAKRLGVSAEGRTVVLMEAVVSDVLVIVAVAAAVAALVAGVADASLAVPVAQGLAVAVVLGAATGWPWGWFITRSRVENPYGVTLAVLLLVYAAAEALGAPGALAVLIFGLMVARAMRHTKTLRRERALGARLIEFHEEAMFFVRAFLFVGIGVVARWDLLMEMRFLAIGVVLTAAVALSRAAGAMVTLRGHLGGRDRTMVMLLFPMGLVTAAASLLPQAAGIPGADVMDEYAAVVIMLSNLAAAVAVFVAARPGKPA